MNYKTYMTKEDLHRDNFIGVVMIADDVLDEVNWPTSMITVEGCVVTQQVRLHDRENSNEVVYEMPNMVGWSTYELYNWLKENEGGEGDHPCVENYFTFIEEGE